MARRSSARSGISPAATPPMRSSGSARTTTLRARHGLGHGARPATPAPSASRSRAPPPRSPPRAGRSPPRASLRATLQAHLARRRPAPPPNRVMAHPPPVAAAPRPASPHHTSDEAGGKAHARRAPGAELSRRGRRRARGGRSWRAPPRPRVARLHGGQDALVLGDGQRLGALHRDEVALEALRASSSIPRTTAATIELPARLRDRGRGTPCRRRRTPPGRPRPPRSRRHRGAQPLDGSAGPTRRAARRTSPASTIRRASFSSPSPSGARGQHEADGGGHLPHDERGRGLHHARALPVGDPHEPHAARSPASPRGSRGAPPPPWPSARARRGAASRAGTPPWRWRRRGGRALPRTASGGWTGSMPGLPSRRPVRRLTGTYVTTLICSLASPRSVHRRGGAEHRRRPGTALSWGREDRAMALTRRGFSTGHARGDRRHATALTTRGAGAGGRQDDRGAVRRALLRVLGGGDPDHPRRDARARGFEIFEAISDQDDNKQFEQVRAAIAREVDGIIIVQTDSNAVIPAIRAANEAGIPMVHFNRPPGGVRRLLGRHPGRQPEDRARRGALLLRGGPGVGAACTRPRS